MHQPTAEDKIKQTCLDEFLQIRAEHLVWEESVPARQRCGSDGAAGSSDKAPHRNPASDARSITEPDER